MFNDRGGRIFGVRYRAFGLKLGQKIFAEWTCLVFCVGHVGFHCYRVCLFFSLNNVGYGEPADVFSHG